LPPKEHKNRNRDCEPAEIESEFQGKFVLSINQGAGDFQLADWTRLTGYSQYLKPEPRQYGDRVFTWRAAIATSMAARKQGAGELKFLTEAAYIFRRRCESTVVRGNFHPIPFKGQSTRKDSGLFYCPPSVWSNSAGARDRSGNPGSTLLPLLPK
jgi:hypothetical protein